MKRISIVVMILIVFVLLSGLVVFAAPDGRFTCEPQCVFTATGVFNEAPTGTVQPTLIPPDGTSYPESTNTADKAPITSQAVND